MPQPIANPVEFITLGMFIIDQIHFPPPRPPIDNIPGGAGLYALLGARIFSAPPLSHSLVFLLDAGRDMPSEIIDVLEEWETGMVVREDVGRLTTRGWNSYEEGDRAFRYLTEKKRLEVQDYVEAGVDVGVCGSLHVICTPGRLRQVLGDLRRECTEGTRPAVVFEPVPDGVSTVVREEMMGVLGEVDVVSPNEREMREFFYTKEEAGEMEGKFDEQFYECVKKLAEGLRSGQGSGRIEGRGVIVRCGKHGSYTYSLSTSSGRWHPAFHTDQTKVVDPTGGGNTFLGAVCVALAREQDVFEAAIWANVAASFAVEQIGLPKLDFKGGNTWNEETVGVRLWKYRERALERHVPADTLVPLNK